jgi:hypothetical protein
MAVKTKLQRADSKASISTQKEPKVRQQEAAPPAAESTPVRVEIKPLNIRRAVIVIRGVTSLVMHAWSEKAIRMIEDKQQKKARGPREAKNPENDFNNARYVIDEGKKLDGVPAIALKACAVEAGMLLGFKKTDLRKLFFVGDAGQPLIPIEMEDGSPCVGTLKRDMVRVGMGTSDVRYRPEYHDWYCRVPVEFNADLLSAEQLINLFDHAGYAVGLGEWRPQKDGPHGRFRVSS